MHLPGVLAQIADVVGYDVAMSIAADHGGTQVHFPAVPGPEHWLSQLIGESEAASFTKRLTASFGLQIEIPFRPIAVHENDKGGLGSEVLDDLAQVIGEQAAFGLAEEFRGERLYVPKSHDLQPRIAKAIGADQAKRFCEAFWRTVVAIPLNVVIARRVLDLAGQGVTKSEIARRVGIRQARVFAIVRRGREGQ